MKQVEKNCQQTQMLDHWQSYTWSRAASPNTRAKRQNWIGFGQVRIFYMEDGLDTIKSKFLTFR